MLIQKQCVYVSKKICFCFTVPVQPAIQQKHCPRIAICVDRAQSYGNAVLQGIAKYVETYGPWSLFIDPRFDGEHATNLLKNWDGDGVLAYVDDLKLADLLRRSRIPVVEIFGHRFDLGLPQVCPDSLAIGQMAARHLIERQFKHFAFCGYFNLPWSQLRQDGFVQTLRAAGFSTEIHLTPRPRKTILQWDRLQQEQAAWIRQLPKPIGIMACSDRHAQRILDACRRANISVPEEIAIIGSGNDDELCRLAAPPLTSVIYDVTRIGYEAAQLLDHLMAGKIKPEETGIVLVSPIGIATRRSTDWTAIDDWLVAKAMRLIRDEACAGLDVDQILKKFSVSKSTFYRRFQGVLGRSPHEEILRVQLERAKNLLAQTDLSVEQIAEMSGFQSPEYLSVAFKRELQQSPKDFRNGGVRK